MSDHDRGAYTPQTDAPLAFDARSPRARRPLPFALIASGAVLLVLVGAIALYYRGGSAPSGADAGGQQVAAVKTAPPADVDQKDAADYLEVYAAQNVPSNATPSAPTFAPPPEQPQPRPAPGLKVVPVETSQIHAPAAAPAPLPAAAPKPITVATAELKPAATPAPPPAAAAPVKPATVATAAPPVAPTAPPPAPVAAAPAASGGALVQIGAFSSNALADKGWQDIASAFPGPMAGKFKKVEPLAKDGSTLYRTSISGWADKASAQAFCAQLKAAGRACFVKG
jgi:hypothetical protein